MSATEIDRVVAGIGDSNGGRMSTRSLALVVAARTSKRPRARGFTDARGVGGR
ncbi:hypothetical protein [Enhygromyxa salina]|uniref:hypothetical protein n=1 Tax=Enhygromyxa salina TaxID=215803 RepID=UPI0004E70F67|nr:hypothetical protein [Enhygromyxa salina]